jgi:Mg2+-importing ATPase
VLHARRRRQAERLAARYAARGLRVIAVAAAARPARRTAYRPADESGLTLLGLVGLREAAEPSAGAAVAALAAQGVAVKIVTGDHPATAARACRDLGVLPGAVVCGDRIDALDEAALTELARRTTVFARATPAHKARIVHALRTAGLTVGFLGDGSNDVPALGAADIGICPPTAIAVARRTADVVLSAPDLTALGGNLHTARRALANIGNYLRITLASNLGNVFSMLVAGALLPFLPMLPSQVLVQNLCFDVAQLALAFDRPYREGAPRPDRVSARQLIRYALLFGLLNTAADLVTFAVLGHLTGGLTAPGSGAVFRTGWLTENLLTQAVTIHLLRAPRRDRRTAAPWSVRMSTLGLAGVGLLLPFTALAAPLGLRPPPPAFYPLLAVTVLGFALAGAAARSLPRRVSRRDVGCATAWSVAGGLLGEPGGDPSRAAGRHRPAAPSA